MTVANLELCKELEKLSGWKSEWMYWKKLVDDYDKAKVLRYGAVTTRDGAKICFAYDLAFLWEKLPAQTYITKSSNGYFYKYHPIGMEVKDIKINGGANTPEDCTAKLCIELIHQGILPPANKNGDE